MPVYGKCPRCEQMVNSLNISTVEARSGSKTYNAATFLCPHCQTVLGAGIDPVAVASDAAQRGVQAVYDAAGRLGKRFDEVEEYLKNLVRDRKP